MALFKLKRKKIYRRGDVAPYSNYDVMVPAPWAEHLLANGFTHLEPVQLSDGALLLRPVHERDVLRERREARRRANRENQRRRYRAVS